MTIEAYKWYEKRQAGLGGYFLQDLENGYDRLEAWPESYAKIKNNFRQLVLRTFPYVIVFEIIKQDIVVYAVFHTSQNPGKKFKK